MTLPTQTQTPPANGTHPDHEPIQFPEAPFCWNTYALAPDGFIEQITIRAATENGLMQRITRLKDDLKKIDYKPAPRRGASEQNATPANADGEEVPNCAIHNKPMVKRSKDGRSWWSCSEKLSDGQWCQYRPKAK